MPVKIGWKKILKRILIGLVVTIALGVGLSIYGMHAFNEFRAKARVSGIKIVARNIKASEDAHREKTGRYSNDVYLPDSRGIIIYTKLAEVAKEDLEIVKGENIPQINENSYTVILKYLGANPEFWRTDQTGEFTKIWPVDGN